jgi:hypothetical protein
MLNSNSLRSVRAAAGAILAVALLLGALLPVLASAAADPVRLAIGSDTGMPGESVIIPLTLEHAEQQKIGSVRLMLEFPSDGVQFAEAHVSIALENAAGKVEAQPAQVDAGKSSVVLVVSAAKPLPDGTIASLEFRIGEKTEGNRDVVLHLKSVELLTTDGKKLADPDRADGKLTISAAPPTLVNCFFFSH